MNSSRLSETAQSPAVALFVSDLHLNRDQPDTAAAFFDFLQFHVSGVPKLFLLGDIFEYWVGDDDLSDPTHQHLMRLLQQLGNSGTELFWMAGNRDFLVGEQFARQSGAVMLEDPTVMTLAERRLILCHGDALCTEDAEYMRFRQQVRNPVWQQQFLAMPLEQRRAIAQNMRNESKQRQQHKTMQIMDVSQAAVEQLFTASGTDLMIHGHTHRPALHQQSTMQAEPQRRYVLSDWDYQDGHQRGDWLCLHGDGGLTRYCLDPASHQHKILIGH